MESTDDLNYYKGYIMPQSGPRLVVPPPALNLNNVPLESASDLSYYKAYLAKL